MARYVRNATVLFKLEVTPGTDPTPDETADALLVSNLTYPEFVANNVDRDNIRGYFGNSEQLVGVRHQTCGFDVEIAGSGTAGTPPAWSPLLQSAAFAEDDQSGYDAYTPLTPDEGADTPTGTIYFFDCGVLHKFTYSRSNVQLMFTPKEIPKLRFTFTGLYQTLTAVAVPVPTLSAWVKPVVVTPANTVVKIGATYSAGAISSGTAYCANAFTLDMGNVINHTAMIGCETVQINDRKPRLDVSLELTAAQEVSYMADVVANTLRAVSITHGTVSGNIVILHLPTVQLTEPKKDSIDGLRLIRFTGIPIPTAAGNDEVVIVAK